jgi:hypothetical protein
MTRPTHFKNTLRADERFQTRGALGWTQNYG